MPALARIARGRQAFSRAPADRDGLLDRLRLAGGATPGGCQSVAGNQTTTQERLTEYVTALCWPIRPDPTTDNIRKCRGRRESCWPVEEFL